MSKIILLAENLPIGGAEMVLLRLSLGLKSRGHNVKLCVLKDDISLKLPKELDVRILKLNKVQTTFKFITRYMQQKFVLNLIKEIGGVDLILSNYSLTRAWMPKEMDEKIYYYVHYDYSFHYNQIQAGLAKKKEIKRFKNVKKRFDNRNIIAVSEGVAESLRSYVKCNPRCSNIIYNPFNISEIRRLALVGGACIPAGDYIVHVARFHLIHKRQDVLIKAFSMIKSSVPLVMLTDDCVQLRSLIKKYHCEDSVHIVGLQDNPFSWIARAKLLILSSDIEGLAGVLVESLMCGTPVVSTDSPGTREVLTGSLQKWIVPCGDAVALASKIDEALEANIDITPGVYQKFLDVNCFRKIEELIA